MADPVKSLIKFAEAQKPERDPWDTLFQETANFLLPRRAAFTSPIVKGQSDKEFMYDDTGPWALEQFANGLHSMMTSPLSRWFDLQIKDQKLRENQAVKEWKDIVVEELYDQFNSSSSSFHPTVQEAYTDIGAFGYAVSYSEWSDDDEAILFQSRFPGECYLIEDQYGRVKGMVRCYKLKCHQFVEAYGADKLSENDKKAYNETGSCRDLEIMHVVLPRAHAMMAPFNIPERYKFGSVRICKMIPKELLAVGGYRSFPFHVARWGKRTGEIYSTSPGINALPSVRRANVIQLDVIKIANRWGDPPSQGPDDEALAPYDLSPGAHNYYHPGTQDRIEGIKDTLGDPSWAVKVLEETQKNIVRTFYVDAFLTTQDSNGQNVKATFINQRKDERFRQLAAMLSRTSREYLSSFVERAFDILEEKKRIPPPPVPGIRLDIEFLSPIARAQRSEQLDGIFPILELSAYGAQYDPSVMTGIKWLEIQRHAAEKVYALPMSWFKTIEEVEQERAAQQQQAALLQQSEAAKNFGTGINNVAQADLASRS